MKKKMTKARIGQYPSLKREIAMLEEQIYSAGNSTEFVTDMVRGSAKEHPYIEQHIVIQGYGSDDIPRLAARKAKRMAERVAIETFIENIADSNMRQILTRRYIEGRGLKETAGLVGYSKGHLVKVLKVFFEKMSQNAPK